MDTSSTEPGEITETPEANSERAHNNQSDLNHSPTEKRTGSQVAETSPPSRPSTAKASASASNVKSQQDQMEVEAESTSVGLGLPATLATSMDVDHETIHAPLKLEAKQMSSENRDQSDAKMEEEAKADEGASCQALFLSPKSDGP